MRIDAIRFNGIADFLGFDVSHGIKCSWNVVDTGSKKQSAGRLELSSDQNFASILYEYDCNDLDCKGHFIEFEPEPCTEYYLRISITGDDGDYTQKIAKFETGKMYQPWQAQWIGPSIKEEIHPVLSTTFQTDKEIVRARLYACGLGLYEASLNGKKIGDEFLAPGLSDYKTEFQVQTYSVEHLLKDENHLEFHLGNGWYKGRFGLEGKLENWGDRFAAIAELHIDYSDGTSQLVMTDSDWNCTGSEIIHSGIYDGEYVDRTLYDVERNEPVKAKCIDLDKAMLVDRYNLPVKIMHELPVKKIINTPSGETVLDMGQNFAGFIRFRCAQPRNTKITLEFGEILQNGCFFNANYRDADARFTYISDGSEEIVQPKFTFYGFRFVRISGWQGPLAPSDFVGCALYSSMLETGHIETSNTKLNQLFSNCVWGQRSNFLDIPTDCPQRDERLGWTGDAQVFAPTACFNMDSEAFYSAFLRFLRHEQQRGCGAIPIYIPSPSDSKRPIESCAVWGDAATIIPSVLYEHYGDKNILKRWYPMMKDWVDYLSFNVADKNSLINAGFQFGDWLAQDGITPQSMKGGTDDYFIASAYYFRSACLLSKAAKELGSDPDSDYYQKLAMSIKHSILDEYFSSTGRLAIDTQTAYIISLKFGIFTDKQKLLDAFLKRLKKDRYQIKSGFAGAPLLCDTLGSLELHDLAYKFILNEDFPGWLYAVNLGATTVWERWNSLNPDGFISGTHMNSFNHYAYGSVIQYFYSCMAGIKSLEPGFAKVCFEPAINGRLESISSSYLSVSGKWVSNWKIEPNGDVTVHYEVPFNCTAELRLPRYCGDVIMLQTGAHDLTYTPTHDFRKIYSADSILADLAKDESAMEILALILPLAHKKIKDGDVEFMTNSLSDLGHMYFMGFTPETVGLAIAEIINIPKQ